MNIRINYLYRDGSNYKRSAEVVFANPARLSLAEIESRLAEAARPWELFPDMVHFQPEVVDLPTCYFTEIGYAESEDDTEVHELHQIVETDEVVTDPRTIEQFLGELRRAGRRGRLLAAGY